MGIRPAISLSGAALALAALALGGMPLSAEASAVAPVTSYVSAADRVQAESVVASFADGHTAPVLVTGATSSQYQAFNVSLAKYWKAVPWTSVYAQWGCTLKNATVDYHATDGAWGVAGASLSTNANCPKNAMPSGINTVAPRTAILRAPKIISPTPDAQQCGTANGNYVCVDSPGTGLISGLDINDNSGSETGHIRLGQVGIGGACGAGALIGNGATVTIAGRGGSTSYEHAVSVDSKFSAQWYDPHEAAEACGTY